MADLPPTGVDTDEADEHALIRACTAGNQQAFARLVDQYKVMVYTLVDRCVGDRDATDDLAQEVFLRVHRGLPAFRGDARLSTWIYRIAYRVCLEELGRPHRRQVYVRLDAQAEDTAKAPPPREAWGRDPAFGQAELSRDVQRWLGGLSPQYRTALTLHYLQGQRYSEIAAIMGVPEGTVKTYLHRAKAALRERILKEERAVE